MCKSVAVRSFDSVKLSRTNRLRKTDRYKTAFITTLRNKIWWENEIRQKVRKKKILKFPDYIKTKTMLVKSK